MIKMAKSAARGNLLAIFSILTILVQTTTADAKIPAYAGMTENGAGMTENGAGMTENDAKIRKAVVCAGEMAHNAPSAP